MAKSSIIPGVTSVTSSPAGGTETTTLDRINPAAGYTPSNSLIVQDAINYDDPGRDQIIPRLGLVNGTGNLAKKFRSDYGKFVYSERLVLGEKVAVIGVKLSKFYIECRRGGIDLKFEDEKRTFATANAAHHAGYAIDFDSKHTDKVEEAATLLLLVSGPKDDPSGDFFIDVGGHSVAPVAFTVRRGGYRSVYRHLFSNENRAKLRGGKLWETVWTLFREEEESKKNDNVWVEPRIEVAARLSAEDVAKLEAILPTFTTMPTAKES